MLPETTFAFQASEPFFFPSFICKLTVLNFFISALLAAKQVPHGGVLVNQMADDKEAAIAKATVELQATERQLCDVQLLMTGGFSPLTGFMDEATYNSVVENMALPDGTVFGLPVVFDTDDEDLQPGTTILLKQGDLPIATVELTDKYTPNKVNECKQCYGTSELEHPGTLMVATERGKYYMGGKVTGLNAPVRDFPCKTPAEVRAELPDDKDVVAFQAVTLSTVPTTNFSLVPLTILWSVKAVLFLFTPLVDQLR